jgi:hypothetical protein
MHPHLDLPAPAPSHAITRQMPDLVECAPAAAGRPKPVPSNATPNPIILFGRERTRARLDNRASAG